MSKELGFVVHTAEDCDKPILDVATELILDGLLERVSGHLIVLLEDEFQLFVVALAHDGVEYWFICSKHKFTGTQKRGRIGLGGIWIGGTRFIAITLA